MAEMQGAQPDAAPGQGSRIAGLTNLAGAAVSMLLIVGVGIWGYKLLVRDVSGVPVVRAAEGPAPRRRLARLLHPEAVHPPLGRPREGRADRAALPR